MNVTSQSLQLLAAQLDAWLEATKAASCRQSVPVPKVQALSNIKSNLKLRAT